MYCSFRGRQSSGPRNGAGQMFKVGDKMMNDADFTSAIGEWFRAGTTFTVVQVGTINTRVQAPNGSLVWLADHKRFFTGNGLVAASRVGADSFGSLPGRWYAYPPTRAAGVPSAACARSSPSYSSPRAPPVPVRPGRLDLRAQRGRRVRPGRRAPRARLVTRARERHSPAPQAWRFARARGCGPATTRGTTRPAGTTARPRARQGTRACARPAAPTGRPRVAPGRSPCAPRRSR
jgi:hypothetical protein